MPPSPILELRDLHRVFGGEPAVAGVSLELAPGEIVGIVGPDGAGKTTTMRMVAGLLTPSEGEVRVLGRSLDDDLHALRSQIGYMPQHYSLYGDLSVQENLRFFAGMYGVSHQDLLEREKRLLGIARLEEFRDRPASALSGGMYKKLALSCALVHSPRLLLLDEPTNGVDPLSRRELWAFLEELIVDGVAVLICTPYMDEAERCHRVGLLVEGKLVALDAPSHLVESFDAAVLELSLSEPVEDLSALRGLEGVDEVYPVGRKLHVVTPDPVALEVLLRESLPGGDALGVETVDPSFEDIFMRLSASAEAHR